MTNNKYLKSRDLNLWHIFLIKLKDILITKRYLDVFSNDVSNPGSSFFCEEYQTGSGCGNCPVCLKTGHDYCVNTHFSKIMKAMTDLDSVLHSLNTSVKIKEKFLNRIISNVRKHIKFLETV